METMAGLLDVNLHVLKLDLKLAIVVDAFTDAGRQFQTPHLCRRMHFSYYLFLV